MEVVVVGDGYGQSLLWWEEGERGHKVSVLGKVDDEDDSKWRM